MRPNYTSEQAMQTTRLPNSSRAVVGGGGGVIDLRVTWVHSSLCRSLLKEFPIACECYAIVCLGS